MKFIVVYLGIAGNEAHFSDCCCNMGHFLWCRKGNAFCERPFALHRQQPEKDKQSVDVAPPTGKIAASLDY